MSACSPVVPDFSHWTSQQVGDVNIATPPGYTVEQADPYAIGIRGPARRTSLAFFFERDEKPAFDLLYYRLRQKREACRANIGGYPADIIAWYDRGQYGLYARWEAEWGGRDAGKWLIASLQSTLSSEARELRAVLHTIRPKAPNH